MLSFKYHYFDAIGGHILLSKLVNYIACTISFVVHVVLIIFPVHAIIFSQNWTL